MPGTPAPLVPRGFVPPVTVPPPEYAASSCVLRSSCSLQMHGKDRARESSLRFCSGAGGSEHSEKHGQVACNSRRRRMPSLCPTEASIASQYDSTLCKNLKRPLWELRSILGPQESSPPLVFLDTSGEELQPEEEEEQPGLGTQEGEGTMDWSSEEWEQEGELTIMITSRSSSLVNEGWTSPDVAEGSSAAPSMGRESPALSLVPEIPPAAFGGVWMPPQAARHWGHGWRAPCQAEEDPASQPQAKVAKQHLQLTWADMEWWRAAWDRLLTTLEGTGLTIWDHTATVAQIQDLTEFWGEEVNLQGLCTQTGDPGGRGDHGLVERGVGVQDLTEFWAEEVNLQGLCTQCKNTVIYSCMADSLVVRGDIHT
ncbi:uncharacterized protein LOC142019263 [Carettochelys insculpta]|uniref:uncharacterized protein LOC142019263 n=1 Tax=Carettochelys insculpta TaxID=44489 RepID=UPI003EBA15A8